MKTYRETIDKALVSIILTCALLLISPVHIVHDFQNIFAQAADNFEGSNETPRAFSSMEPLPEPPTALVNKLDLFKLFAKLPEGPRFKSQKTLETQLPPPAAKISEPPRVEPPSSHDTPSKTSGLVDVRTYGFTEAAIKKAIDTNQGKCTLYFSSGTWRVGSNLNIPERVAIKIENGATLSIAPGATLLINGPLVDCLWQIFNDENTDLTKGVKLARHSVTYVRPEWWGLKSANNIANANGAANWKALTKALNCSTTAKAEITVLFSPGQFFFNDTIKLTPHCHLKGQNNFSSSGYEGTRLQLVSGTNKYFFEGDHIDGPVLENLFISGGYNDADCIYIHGGHYGEIKNCFLQGTGLGKTRYAIKMAPQNQMAVENCRILAGNGIYGGNMDGWIRSCEIRGPGYGSSNVGIKAVESPLIQDCIIYGFARGIDAGRLMLIYGNRIDQCTICIGSGKENILSGVPYTVPASPPYTLTVEPHDWAFKDYGVMRQKDFFTDDSIHLTRVPANPGPGQYTVKDAPYGGTYSFNKAEAGKKLWFNYRHSIESGGATLSAQIIGNRMGTAIIVIDAAVGSPTIIGNILGSSRSGGNGCAVSFRGSGGLLAYNKFLNNDRNLWCDTTRVPLECHDNLGIDRATDSGTVSSLISGDMPEVYAGDLWETQNSSPTNITAIKSAAEGHKITLIVDKNTTLQKYWEPSDIYLTSDNNATFRTTAGNNHNFSGQKDFSYFQGPKDDEIIYFGDYTRFNSLLFHIKDKVAAKTLAFNWEYGTQWGWIPTMEQVQTWKPDTLYPAGSVVKPGSGTTPLVYISQKRGTSGRTEPNWKKVAQGEYDLYAIISDLEIGWRPFYPLKVANSDALQASGPGTVEVLLTPPPSTCWIPVNPKDVTGSTFPGGTKFWLRCRLSGVTGGTNGGSNDAHAIKKCNIRLATETFNPPLKAILNLIYHNHSWLEVGRRLL
ncbi:MAG: hypothetical protein WC600_04415 [Desulfobaccales bacterium]